MKNIILKQRIICVILLFFILNMSFLRTNCSKKYMSIMGNKQYNSTIELVNELEHTCEEVSDLCEFTNDKFLGFLRRQLYNNNRKINNYYCTCKTQIDILCLTISFVLFPYEIIMLFKFMNLRDRNDIYTGYDILFLCYISFTVELVFVISMILVVISFSFTIIYFCVISYLFIIICLYKMMSIHKIKENIQIINILHDNESV